MFSLRHRRRVAPAAFSLLELVTVILIVSILVIMLMPLFTFLRDRSERARCIANMKGLHVAAGLYLQEHHHWPQVPSKGVAPNDLATAWIDTLRPYGLEQINWICPSVQRSLHNPDLSDHVNTRTDYGAFPFDSKPTTPFKWSNMPWFIENSNVHGGGALIIYPDGHTEDSGELIKSLTTPSPSIGH